MLSKSTNRAERTCAGCEKSVIESSMVRAGYAGDTPATAFGGADLEGLAMLQHSRAASGGNGGRGGKPRPHYPVKTGCQERDAAGMAACYHPRVRFSDPVFLDLDAAGVGAMWEMLCQRAQDLQVGLRTVGGDGRGGHRNQ